MPRTRGERASLRLRLSQLGPARCIAITVLLLWGAFAAVVSLHRSAVAGPPPVPRSAVGNGTLEMVIEDLQTGRPLAARIAIWDSKNRLRRLPGVVTEGNTFSAFYELILKFPDGDYRYEAEAGPEYRPMSGTFTIQTNTVARHKVQLERAVDLADESWAFVEQGVFTRADEADVLAAAIQADHVGARTGPFPERRGRRDFAVPSEPHHTWFAWHPLELGEARLALWDPSRRPFAEPDGEDESAAELDPWPTDLAELQAWRSADLQRRVLLDSPLARSLPLWVGLQLIDGVTLIGPYDGPGAERFPERGYDIERADAASPRKRLERSLEAYRQLVSAGVPLPVTALSRWTDLDRPLGIHRTMTATEIDGRAVAPWDALQAGRTWVSNGPLVRFTFGRQPVGSVLQGTSGETLSLDLGLKVSSRSPLRVMEIYRNGQLERSLTAADLARDPDAARFTFDNSGWLMGVAWAGEDDSPQVAITSPFRIEFSGPAPSDVDAVARMLEKLEQLEADERFVIELQLDEATFEQAKQFWNDKLPTSD